MKVIKITPRGFCSGVINALKIATEASSNPRLPRPIYILGNIVHNHFISDALKELGLTTVEDKNKTRLELLDQIEGGTVIFTAHGVADAVIEKAKEKGLYFINATCQYVNKTNDYIKEKIADGYDIIYIGKKNHPEPEGAIGINPDKVHLVENRGDVKLLKIDNFKITVTNQTTMSAWDIMELSGEIKRKYPHSELFDEICNATRIRQEAVLKEAVKADLTIVVGDPLSNNTNKLARISETQANTIAYLVETVEDIKPEWLKGKSSVAVTSGASTPTAITNEVIEYLERFDSDNPDTYAVKSSLGLKNILPSIKNGKIK